MNGLRSLSLRGNEIGDAAACALGKSQGITTLAFFMAIQTTD